MLHSAAAGASYARHHRPSLCNEFQRRWCRLQRCSSGEQQLLALAADAQLCVYEQGFLASEKLLIEECLLDVPLLCAEYVSAALSTYLSLPAALAQYLGVLGYALLFRCAVCHFSCQQGILQSALSAGAGCSLLAAPCSPHLLLRACECRHERGHSSRAICSSSSCRA